MSTRRAQLGSDSQVIGEGSTALNTAGSTVDNRAGSMASARRLSARNIAGHSTGDSKVEHKHQADNSTVLVALGRAWSTTGLLLQKEARVSGPIRPAAPQTSASALLFSARTRSLNAPSNIMVEKRSAVKLGQTEPCPAEA